MTEQQRNAEQKVQMLSTTRAMLKKFHRILNQELASLLDDNKFTWPELMLPADSSQKSDEVSGLVLRHATCVEMKR
jgi:galactokinase